MPLNLDLQDAQNCNDNHDGGSIISRMNPNKTKTLILKKNQHLSSELFYLEKGWNLKFEQGTSLIGEKIKLFTNYPRQGEHFDRQNYQELKWECESQECSPLFAILKLDKAGAFHYFYTDENRNTHQLGSGYFIIDPVLSLPGGKVLPIDSITAQTVLAKCLGKFKHWENRLRVSKETGYNMIHFTPIQELGGSKSCYSLKDQLRLNPEFGSEDFTPTFEDVLQLTDKMRKEWKVLSIGDVVLNHTANESPWLRDHPECTYNMITSPHLIPAAVLDAHLHIFTMDVSEGKYEDKGIPKDIRFDDHLQAVKTYLEYHLVPNIRLHEFYMVDVDKLCQEFRERSKDSQPKTRVKNRDDLTIQRESISGRYQAKIDMDLALDIFNIHRNTADEDDNLAACVEDFKNRLLELNEKAKHETRNHLTAAIDNCIASMRYFRVQEDGPRIREISPDNPLIPRYFTGTFESVNTIETEILGPTGKFVMAHNGWVMNSDPLKNFAESDSNVYLRRELISWGDSVKLRYGKTYNDCPFLWDHMRTYVEISAKIFDGLRLDNCHSTPLHVAEYLLDSARRVRPDLYVAAELFTNSDVTDNIFANRLGITAMIRETSTAFNSHELGRLVHRYGGEPVGSFVPRSDTPLRPSVAHALFYDVTHDNPNPIEKKNIFYLIPVAGLISMACCATGSNRGIDELVPHQIDVVKEKRFYPSWTYGDIVDETMVNSQTGIIPVKKILNEIHHRMFKEGFNEVYVDQMNEDIVAVTRHNPSTHESIILVAHTAFFQPSTSDAKPIGKNLKVEAQLSEILIEAKLLNRNQKNVFEPPKNFIPNADYINGLSEYEVSMKSNIDLNESDMIEKVQNGQDEVSEFKFKNFPPGSIIILRFRPFNEAKEAFKALREVANQSLNLKFDDYTQYLVSNFDLKGLNKALYCCENEGLEIGTGPYNVPGCGSLVYCGVQGFESVLKDLRVKNDLGHPFCDNLRQGPWMLDYLLNQLRKASSSQDVEGIQQLFNHLRHIPKYLLPKYFDLVVSFLCQLLEWKATSLMSPFVRNGTKFLRHLALGSVQCLGHVNSAPLPAYSKKVVDALDGQMTMSAGLPHFSTGYMRSWGRDTFISLRGLLLLTGRFDDARNHILGYAACLRHGLIPNLLDRGVNARYNCRDAVWWWLYAIISYVHYVPDGHQIFRELVSRIFPTNDSPHIEPGLADQPLHDVMQESLNTHFQGLTFRERNAGSTIDAHMTDQGFNITIGVDPETGFVQGGNEFNCGTWMDKMGSDEKTGNKGKPATPRDGSAVEIVALCKAVVRELHLLNEKGFYPYEGVEKRNEQGDLITWTFQQWENKISENFEKFFWIPETPTPWERHPEMIHRRIIYKDCWGSSQLWADYQLRPNFLVALTVAPEMVKTENAWKAIQTAEKILLGPLGIKTLDPDDWNYNGYYHNDDNSNNPKTAHGFNYHQGPEWLWLVGFFLRSKLIFANKLGPQQLEKAKTETWSYLRNHYNELFESPWRGLPELTNKNGEFCSDGCRVQAWSMACLLETLHSLTITE